MARYIKRLNFDFNFAIVFDVNNIVNSQTNSDRKVFILCFTTFYKVRKILEKYSFLFILYKKKFTTKMYDRVIRFFLTRKYFFNRLLNCKLLACHSHCNVLILILFVNLWHNVAMHLLAPSYTKDIKYSVVL